MRTRRVVLTVEVETCAPLRYLRRPDVVRVILAGAGEPADVHVVQVTANVVEPKATEATRIVAAAARARGKR